ncbi:MAG: hypothetical protein PHV34_18145 [Verrucomicrobiae bacterium]|nr:hypothetical protein [Verrucomicrobiae bacterium]
MMNETGLGHGDDVEDGEFDLLWPAGVEDGGAGLDHGSKNDFSKKKMTLEPIK